MRTATVGQSAPGGAAPEVLLETPGGVTEIDVAATVALEGGLRPAGQPSYGPPHPSFLAAGACALVPVLGLALLIRPVVRRSRQRRARLRTG